MVGKKKAKEVLEYLDEHGLDAAIEHYNVKKDSVLRYVRKAKKIVGESHGDEKIEFVPQKEIKRNQEPKTGRYLVIGCVHVPFNNKKLTQGLFDLMKDVNYKGIIIAGDFLDMGALSTYEKGKLSNTGVTLEDEYIAGNQFLNIIDQLLPKNATKVFMFGNHCHRYWKWKSDVDNSKYGDSLNPITSLALEQRGYDVYHDYVNDIYNLGSLGIMHGEYFNIHCAKKHLDVFRRNILFFHTHRFQIHREGDFAAYNAGFLGDKKSPAFNYAKRGMKAAWANGFAEVTLMDSGEHFVNLISCVNDKFAVNGKVYGGI